MTFKLNQLVQTPAGQGRLVGVFHDKPKKLDAAIVCLAEGQKDYLSGSGPLIYVPWDQVKEPELELQPQPWVTRVEPDGATLSKKANSKKEKDARAYEELVRI
jgi:hypothetical protein